MYESLHVSYIWSFEPDTHITPSVSSSGAVRPQHHHQKHHCTNLTPPGQADVFPHHQPVYTVRRRTCPFRVQLRPRTPSLLATPLHAAPGYVAEKPHESSESTSISTEDSLRMLRREMHVREKQHAKQITELLAALSTATRQAFSQPAQPPAPADPPADE